MAALRRRAAHRRALCERAPVIPSAGGVPSHVSRQIPGVRLPCPRYSSVGTLHLASPQIDPDRTEAVTGDIGWWAELRIEV